MDKVNKNWNFSYKLNSFYKWLNWLVKLAKRYFNNKAGFYFLVFHGLQTMKCAVKSPKFLNFQVLPLLCFKKHKHFPLHQFIYLHNLEPPSWNSICNIDLLQIFKKKSLINNIQSQIKFRHNKGRISTLSQRGPFSNSNDSTQALCNCCCRQQLPPTSSFRTDDSRSIFSIHFQGALLKPFSNTFKKLIQPFCKEPMNTKSNLKYRLLHL